MRVSSLYEKDIVRLPLLTPEEENQASPEELINGNVRLALKIAHEYRYGADFDDIVSAANEGLVEAAHRFDPEKGVPFPAYAQWWIKNHIRCLFREVEKAGFWWCAGTADVESLDAPLPGPGTFTVGDVTPDPSRGPEAFVEATEVSDLTSRALEKLSDQERHVLFLYYGLDGCPRTLEQIGKELGLSKERVRQIREKALYRAALSRIQDASMPARSAHRSSRSSRTKARAAAV